MPRYDYRTAIGGTKTKFGTTSWTKILDARTSTEERHSLIINELLDRYWKPVYCYLRHKGYDNEKAKDLTQGFFHEVVLGRDLLKQADKAKGKFRTFLLTALDRYTVDVYREETAKYTSVSLPSCTAAPKLTSRPAYAVVAWVVARIRVSPVRIQDKKVNRAFMAQPSVFCNADEFLTRSRKECTG